MSEITSPVIKKVVRRKKVVSTAETASSLVSPISTDFQPILEDFNLLLEKIKNTREEYEKMQKQISQIKESWIKEQKEHEIEVSQRRRQEEIERKREGELYEYETSLFRKKAEDQFNQKKLEWERELTAQKEKIEVERRELEVLRKQAAAFEQEKEKAVKAACGLLHKDLEENFTTEAEMKEQKNTADKEILSLKISTLTSENSRQAKEIENLKRALEQATNQVKEIAVKVIESGSQASSSTSQKPQE